MMSTAFANLFLFCGLAFMLRLLWRSHGASATGRWGMVALVIPMLAALLGVCRALPGASQSINDAYFIALNFAGEFGTVPLALSYTAAVFRRPERWLFGLLALAALPLIFYVHHYVQSIPQYREATGGLALGFVLLAALARMRERPEWALLAVAGIGLFLFARLVVGIEGNFKSVPWLDYYLYLMAIVWLQFTLSLRRIG